MKITALGTGGAFTKYYHNNYIVELKDSTVLIDAGTTLRYSLPAAGYQETDITDIIITHLHSDHVGGLEEFAQRCKWIHNHKPTLWIHEELLGRLHQVIRNGLCTDGLKISDYFNVKYVRNNILLKGGDIHIVDTNNLHAEGMFSYGLRINDWEMGTNIIFTSDIAKHEEAGFRDYIDNYTMALFHDVSLVKNAVHSYLDDVIEYYKENIPLNKIYAMHYQDDQDIEKLEKETRINFAQARRTYTF